MAYCLGCPFRWHDTDCEYCGARNDEVIDHKNYSKDTCSYYQAYLKEKEDEKASAISNTPDSDMVSSSAGGTAQSAGTGKAGRGRKADNEPKGFAGTVYTLAHDLLYVLAIITVVFVFLARLTGVHGDSMLPTLYGEQDGGGNPADYLVLLSNVVCADYQPGDIVVACVPSFEDGKPIVKRVIATEGQTVSFERDTDESGEMVFHVYVDGVLQDESFINHQSMHRDFYDMAGQTLTVPANCYFLMGDNRDNSSDSRNPQIGMVDRQYIVGKAIFIVLPGGDGSRDWSRFGILN